MLQAATLSITEYDNIKVDVYVVTTQVYCQISGGACIPLRVRNLCEMAGVRSASTVYAQLKELEENGFIERMKAGSRTMAVVKRGIP